MKLELILPDEFKEELKTALREIIKEELLNIQPQKENQGKEHLLSRKEACEFLHCSLTTLYNHQRKGVIPYYKVGRRILFSKKELLLLLKK